MECITAAEQLELWFSSYGHLIGQPRIPRGELSESQIAEIKAARRAGATVGELAKLYGTNQSHISELTAFHRAIRLKAADRKAYKESQIRAGMAVSGAIQEGKLANLKETVISCTDCKKSRATVYEHRDYAKPLEVDPVCNRCNRLRGPAKLP